MLGTPKSLRKVWRLRTTLYNMFLIYSIVEQQLGMPKNINFLLLSSQIQMSEAHRADFVIVI